MRSGSTWLAEVLSASHGNLQVFEPLHPDYVPRIKDTFPHRQLFINPEKEWPEGKEIFDDILSGKINSPWTLSQATIKNIIPANRLVVKFIRGNLLLDWFTRTNHGLEPILVIRHPCAVIASHIHKGWQPSKKAILKNSYFDTCPEIKKKCEQLSSIEEVAALSWCMKYHAPLSSPPPYKFILLTYEQLVLNGEFELRKIFSRWSIPVDETIFLRLKVPSDTTEANSNILKNENLLSGWQKKLSNEQVENILNVLKIFNLNFYSKQVEPDYLKLNTFQQDNYDEK